MKHFILILIICLAPVVAFAEPDETATSCTEDADCPVGTTCQPISTPAISCAPDEECPDEEPTYACVAGPDTCENDADCEQGFECIRFPCPECLCPPCEEEECPPCECPPCDETGICAPKGVGEPVGQLVGGPCDTDEQCPISFSCQEVQTSSCDTKDRPTSCVCPDCVPGEDCPPCDCDELPEEQTDEEACVPETANLCVFEPIDCMEDADICGEGFYCAPIESCMSSGSAGMACVCPDCPEGEECPPCDCDDVPEPPVEEEICETEAAICAPEEIECAENSDCPEGWECAQIEQAGATICACPPCEDGEECPPCDCDDIDEEQEDLSICLPEGWLDILGPALSDGRALDETLVEPGTTPNIEPGTNNEPAEPTGAENASGSGGGCSVAPSGSPMSGGLFVLMLLIAGLRLRQRNEAT
ncbi:MAG: hypothetical protein CMH54_09215 [Myxococcales bacterium]|nr:hypothetical protein [Myxococcales bacterium]